MLFDASDKDDMINLADWPTVKGMYQPDAIATFETGGKRCEPRPHTPAALSSLLYSSSHSTNPLLVLQGRKPSLK